MISQSRPVLIAFSVLAGLDVLLGGAALGEVGDPQFLGVATLLQAGVAVGLSYYVQGKVTPMDAVAARELPNGIVVAGPAGPVTEGKKVDVTEAGPANWT